MRNKVLVLAAAMLSSAYGLVSGYHVEPVKAAWSGWTAFQGYVSEVLTINFDELDSVSGSYCELFAGSKGGGGQYNLSVLTYPGGTQIAQVAHHDGNVDHQWVRFYLDVTTPESIVKGKKLEFRFTRSGGDSVHYYYNPACGYGYGQMIAPYRYGLLITAPMLVQAA